jgi:leucyl/phenylalanyl-tRNA---protein transferase
MPVFRLTNDLVFPPPRLAEEDGLLAVGGDLSVKRLLLGYSMGIFPWYSEGSAILWWSPDPRLVLLPKELRVSRSLSQTIRKGRLRVTFDTAFEQVIVNCADLPRRHERGTWITEDMREAYCRLHAAGYAHSVESWYEDELAGGLYGVALGGIFFGESMFTRRRDASKVALVKLVAQLVAWDFRLIDCQITTRHLVSLGAKEMPRSTFVELVRGSLQIPTPRGSWSRITGSALA